jgi:hypothetical protein
MPRFKNKNQPSFYQSIEEMDKPLSVLMEDLRGEIHRTRGKLGDMKRAFGWDDRIEPLEGVLTCMLMTMYGVMEEFQNFEKKFEKNTETA